MTQPQPNSRADRWLAAKRRDPGAFLFCVIACAMWGAGLVDLATYRSGSDILGQYGVAMFGLFAACIAAWLGWLTLIITSNGCDQVRRAVKAVQVRAWLAVGLLIVFGGVVASMFMFKIWAYLPLAALAVLAIGLMFLGMVLFSRSEAGRPMPIWRKVLIAVLIGVLGLELALQTAAALNVLPIQNLAGLQTPYGRVYQNRLGSANGITNRYGWYFPDEPLSGSGKLVALIGDTYVQGLQTAEGENVGMQLHNRLQRLDGSRAASFGFAGYGLGLYADPALAPFTLLRLNPKEVVLFVHLANDFQTVSTPGGEVPYFYLNDKGEATSGEQDAKRRHTLQHIMIRGYDPASPIYALQTYSFLWQALWQLVGFRYTYADYGEVGAPPQVPEASLFADGEHPFGLNSAMFDKRRPASAAAKFALAKAQLAAFTRQLKELGIDVRLVTIPHFPAQFYDRGEQSWTPDMGDYDLLLPERELVSFAHDNGIPALPMGEYMQRKGLGRADIKLLYTRDGSGPFTPAGHAYFADAIYECFYEPSAECPVKARN